MKIHSNDKHQGLYNAIIVILPYIFIVGLFQILAAYFSGYDYMHSNNFPPSSLQSFVSALATVIGTIVTILLLQKNQFDLKSFIRLGLQKISVKKELILGLLLGFLIIFMGFLTLLFTNEISIQSFDFNFTELLLNAGLFICVAISEEILCRGYMLSNLMKSYNKYVALAISAVLFSLLHIANDFISILNLFDLFIAGILLGICYIFTRRLWFAIALHFSWNFFQGTIFGFNVSGNDNYSLLQINYSNPSIWNGGGFGFEGSVLSIVFQVVAIYLIYNHYNNKRVTLSLANIL
jgi:membrane protease YdiL (CAAX protease family)